MEISELQTNGGRYAIKNRLKGLGLFEDYLTRPWLGCELSLNLVNVEPFGDKTRKEYGLLDGVETTVNYKSSVAKPAIYDSAILTGITIPNLGLDFMVNGSMAGGVQPKLQHSNMQLRVVLPAAKQDKYLTSKDVPSSKIAAHMGIFGSLYDNQFTTYGTLRIDPFRPTLLLALETTVLDGYETYSPHSLQAIQLYAFHHCNFSKPTPVSMDSSDKNALTFLINVSFEDYDEFQGTTPPNNELNTVEVGQAKASLLSVLAKTKLAEEAAKAVSRVLGKSRIY